MWQKEPWLHIGPLSVSLVISWARSLDSWSLASSPAQGLLSERTVFHRFRKMVVPRLCWVFLPSPPHLSDRLAWALQLLPALILNDLIDPKPLLEGFSQSRALSLPSLRQLILLMSAHQQSPPLAQNSWKGFRIFLCKRSGIDRRKSEEEREFPQGCARRRCGVDLSSPFLAPMFQMGAPGPIGPIPHTQMHTPSHTKNAHSHPLPRSQTHSYALMITYMCTHILTNMV